jgi:hypothetical protein
MNYHFIKNNFEIIEHIYPDKFDIKIYYMSDNYCYIFTKRLDSNNSWGMNPSIKLYDLSNNNYEIINIESSDNNTKIVFFNTNILLERNENDNKNILPKIPSIIHPREYRLIENKFKILNNEKNIDLHIVIYKLNEENKIKIIVRRLDCESGWNDNLKLELYDNYFKNRKELINIGSSEYNYKCIVINTKIDIYKLPDYNQNIPFYIIQTGYNPY